MNVESIPDLKKLEHTRDQAIQPVGLVRACGLLVNWNVRRASVMLPLAVIIQLTLSAATIVGYSLLVGDSGTEAKQYLLTGAPVISLITIGFAMTPQMIMQARVEGSFAWLQTLPVPRLAFLLADLIVWTLVALPGLALSLALGRWYFGVPIVLSWTLIPAALLISGISTSIGYSGALIFAPPVPQLLAQVCVFIIMLFSPISFPASRLPQWGQSLHHWLPFEPMAQVIRSSLSPNVFTTPTRSWIVLLVWAVVAIAVAGRALSRRP